MSGAVSALISGAIGGAAALSVRQAVVAVDRWWVRRTVRQLVGDEYAGDLCPVPLWTRRGTLDAHRRAIRQSADQGLDVTVKPPVEG